MLQLTSRGHVSTPPHPTPPYRTLPHPNLTHQCAGILVRHVSLDRRDIYHIIVNDDDFSPLGTLTADKEQFRCC